MNRNALIVDEACLDGLGPSGRMEKGPVLYQVLTKENHVGFGIGFYQLTFDGVDNLFGFSSCNLFHYYLNLINWLI